MPEINLYRESHDKLYLQSSKNDSQFGDEAYNTDKFQNCGALMEKTVWLNI